MVQKPVALVSVTDKSGIAEFCSGLQSLGWDIVSSGGTAKLLQQNSIPTTQVSDLTGFPEMLDGRVKTLQPQIHGGILWDRSNPEHKITIKTHGIRSIDMVVVNLYPFERQLENLKNSGASTASVESFKQMIEYIDIGGPTLLRAAAKNSAHVISVIDPADYNRILELLKTRQMEVHSTKDSQPPKGLQLRVQLAAKVFKWLSEYNKHISEFYEQFDGLPNSQATPSDSKNESAFIHSDMPSEMVISGQKTQDLRYGENPDQNAAVYTLSQASLKITDASQLNGKPMSYNNWLDVDAASDIVRHLSQTTHLNVCSVIKHNNPCGVAQHQDSCKAFELALAGDPKSAFGGIVAVNYAVDESLAVRMSETFLECIIAPEFSPEALAVFSKKKNLRILKWPPLAQSHPTTSGATPAKMQLDKIKYHCITGAILVQDSMPSLDPTKFTVPTSTKPSDTAISDLHFAFGVVANCRSNAIVLVKDGQAIGIGCGLQSRIDAVDLAIKKAKDFDHPLAGAYLASDAFFPFGDSVETAVKAGIAGIIQPGGSMRDEESITAADKAGIPMMFTHTRRFRH